MTMQSSNPRLVITVLVIHCLRMHVAFTTTSISGHSGDNGEESQCREPSLPSGNAHFSKYGSEHHWGFPSQGIATEEFHTSPFSEMEFFCSPELASVPTQAFSFPSVVELVGECEVINGSSVNCTSRNLRDVPKTDFPIEIKSYDLSNNTITHLPDRAFVRYIWLEVLILQRNNISRIDPLAFLGLSNLEKLDLHDNNLVMNQTMVQTAFSEYVFQPLKKLRILRLNRNNPQPAQTALSYPARALSQLTSLETLFLDGFRNAVFGSDFAKLTHLTCLSLAGHYINAGYCSLFGLQNYTFLHFPHLQHLILKDCHLQGHRIQAGTFLPLKNLTHLDISYNEDINVQFFDQVFYGLQNTSTLRYLNMEFVVNFYTLGVCLSSKYINYFPQSVEYLNIKSNKLEAIDRKVIDKVRKSLRVLDISHNSFVFGTYLQDLFNLTELTTLIINSSLDDSFIRLPKIYPFNPHTPALDTDNCSLYETKDSDPGGEQFILRLPPKLETVNILFTDLKYILSELKVKSDNNLKSLMLIGNYIPKLNGPIKGLNKLKHFQLMYNHISHISETFFHTFPSLEMLNLSCNDLGGFFENNPNSKMFRKLNTLQRLDLSLNAIRILGHKLFRGLVGLKTLRLSHNPLICFHSDISHMNKLQQFIVDDTRLLYLPHKTRHAIDERLQSFSSFHVDLQESPIFCDCQNLDFLKWMTTSKAFTFESEAYRCYYPDATFQDIRDGYQDVIRVLAQACTPHQTLFFIVASATCVAVIFTLASLIYRYRWKLRYVYYATYMYLKAGDDANAGRDFEYDAFVCYTEEESDFVLNDLDAAMEARGVNLLIQARDFPAGEFISSSIVKAVRTSRRTLVVLTRAMVRSSWCGYKIQMANMESTFTGRPVLIFLLVDEMTGDEMGLELLFNVRNNMYMPFPPASHISTDSLNRVWDKLAMDIKT